MLSKALLLWVFAAGLAFAADKKEIDVSASAPADQQWTDSGVDLKAGDLVTITATGSVQYDGARTTGPEGLARGWMDLIMQFPVNAAGRGALVGRIGDSPAARAFLVGANATKTAPIAGHLFLGINQMPSTPGTGSFHVVIERKAGVAPTTAAKPIAAFTQEMLEQLPTRVNDAQGNLGDRVNFVVIGSQENVQTALSAAGWVPVDKTKGDAVVSGLLRSLSKEAYVSMPMSELELFGRVQDFGYAQGDPLMVVASRHHFRIWRAPFKASEETVWAGAGTHDIGFEKDQRNGHVTHKIEPVTDGERDYIGQSFTQSGMVLKEEYLTAAHAIKEARTATGGGFSSDGRTLIIYLQSDARK
jgi:LssY C-terminus